MDGPIVVFMVAYLIVPIIWVYKRYFEAAGVESPALVAFCQGRPVLAVLHASEGRASELAKQLRTSLGRRSETALTLGRWPWTHHVVRVEVRPVGSVVRIEGVSCRVRLARENVTSLTESVLLTLRQTGLSSKASWLNPEVYVRTGVDAPHGWRALPESAEKFPLEAWEQAPSWAAEGAGAATFQDVRVSAPRTAWQALRVVSDSSQPAESRAESLRASSLS
jgi:hypothetical protein